MAPKKAAKEEPPVAAEEIRFERMEEEEQCERIFKELDKAFKKLPKITKPDKIHVAVRDITTKLKEAKTLIKDFEREARANGMPAGELGARKKALASELNGYIALKKDFAESEGSKADLLNGAQGEIELGQDGMSMQQLMTKGRKDIDETDKALARTERLWASRCIAFLLLLTVVGVVAIIVVKIIKPNKDKVVAGATAIANSTINAINSTSAGSAAISGTTGAVGTATGALGRRALVQVAIRHLLELNATL
ncbi:putative plant SNARE 11 [Tetrabaena socialis]|uniref:Putative plant SNARE 11 n=1 Tax=Tetrabaena socialis TaxID=47790 RepID=A0A2J7ZT77_9CHLO|nr:putative plant SNARE 11 [Tetrabaena socialis]|eukprot:PNH03475.1 putative plant SNARE 11 [Tetrabaena socialis]